MGFRRPEVQVLSPRRKYNIAGQRLSSRCPLIFVFCCSYYIGLFRYILPLFGAFPNGQSVKESVRFSETRPSSCLILTTLHAYLYLILTSWSVLPRFLVWKVVFLRLRRPPERQRCTPGCLAVIGIAPCRKFVRASKSLRCIGYKLVTEKNNPAAKTQRDVSF